MTLIKRRHIEKWFELVDICYLRNTSKQSRTCMWENTTLRKKIRKCECSYKVWASVWEFECSVVGNITLLWGKHSKVLHKIRHLIQKLFISASRVLLRLPSTKFKLMFYKDVLNSLVSAICVTGEVRGSLVRIIKRILCYKFETRWLHTINY